MQGVVLGGNVRLEAAIGRGGAGEVWRATHLGLGREVAVKLLAEQPAGDPDARARFLREAQLIARLDHPHVVKIFDVNISPEGRLYVVLELLVGADLKSRVEDGPISVEETLSIIEQTASALGAAHALGIIHRDVKPANIFLVSGLARRVKVLDFGIAKAAEAGVDRHLTMTGMMMGSPYYMSPEQFMDPRRVDHRTDLWSLAVTAYACLTGSLPFLGESVGALAVAVNTGAFTPARQLAPSLPIGIDAWFAQGLARAPGARFASAHELASALRDVIASGVAHPLSGLAQGGLTSTVARQPLQTVDQPQVNTSPAPVSLAGLRFAEPPAPTRKLATKRSLAAAGVLIGVVAAVAFTRGHTSDVAAADDHPSMAPAPPIERAANERADASAPLCQRRLRQPPLETSVPKGGEWNTRHAQTQPSSWS